MKMDEQKQEVTREKIIARLADWKTRLENLFSDIEKWYHELPDDQNHRNKLLRGSILQDEEELMEKFDVQPEMVPQIAIFYGKNRISFVPAALWVNAANGRIDVITNNDDDYILVDLGGKEGRPSEWFIVNLKNRNSEIPFDKETFRNLVLQRALKAA